MADFDDDPVPRSFSIRPCAGTLEYTGRKLDSGDFQLRAACGVDADEQAVGFRVAEFHAGREELFGARTRLGEPFVQFAGEADGIVAGDVIVV